MAFQNNTVYAGDLNVYVYGSTGGLATSPHAYLTDPTSGNLTNVSPGQNLPSFTVKSNRCLYLPPLAAARVYVVLNNKAIDLPVVMNGNGVLQVPGAITVEFLFIFAE